MNTKYYKNESMKKEFNMKVFKNTNQKSLINGFTLIETLVAISILVIAVAAPLTLASRSLFVATYAKDQQAAYYLAQEAIEMVRNKRDGNQLSFLKGNTITWLSGIPTGTPFQVDVPNSKIIPRCGTMDACRVQKLQFNGNFFTYGVGGTGTLFGRSVEVVVNPTTPKGAVITAVVDWKTGSFKKQKVTLSEQIYNWLPNQN